MIIISHRGNLNGPNPQDENKPDYIDSAYELTAGKIQIEADIRFIDKKWYLGHDGADYPVSLRWMKERNHFIWWHVKNLDALVELNRISAKSHEVYLTEDQFSRKQVFFYFWHQNDDYTLTSGGHIWTFPNKPIRGKNSIIVLNNKQDVPPKGIFGICTDYPLKYV